jgi:hypothetical protein
MTSGGKRAPSADSLRHKLCAAIFSAWRAWLAERLVPEDSTLPPLILVPRAQTEPGAEVLDAGEAADIWAYLGEQLHHHRHPQPVDAGEVHAGPVGQALANVVLHARLAARARQLAQGDLGPRPLVRQPVQPSIAVGQVPPDVVVHRQRLLEHKQVAFGPRAGRKVLP